MSLYQLTSILKAYKWLVLSVFFITVIGVTMFTFLSKKTYQASTSLVVNLQGVDPISGTRIPSQMIPGYMATQVDIIASKRVAKQVVDRLGLFTDQGLYESYQKSTQGGNKVKGWLIDNVVEPFGLTPVSKGGESEGWVSKNIVERFRLYRTPVNAGQSGIDIRSWIAEILLQGLTVLPSRESSVITIKSEAGTPEFAALLANTFAAAYIDTSIQLKKEPSQRTAAWFEGQVEKMRQRLAEAQSTLSNYQREKGIVYADERLSVTSNELSQLTQQLVTAKADLFNLEAQNRAINSGNIQSLSLDVMQDPVINQLQSALTRSEIKLNDIRHRVGTNHPDYLSAKSEVASLTRKLNRQIRSAKSKLRSSLEIVKSRVSDLQKSVEAHKKTLLALNDGRSQLALLQRAVDDNQRILSQSVAQLSKMRLEADSTESDVTVLAPAESPLRPSKPKVFLNIALSMVMGVILGIGMALMVELINRKVRSARDVENRGANVLGEVPFYKKAGAK